jgi:hypothetical protein
MPQPTNDQILELLFIIAPQFKTDDTIILESYYTLIEALECFINPNVLACCAVMAYANLLAHFLTLQKNPVLGISSSLSEGQLSIYTATTTGMNFLSATPYGQAYQQIIGKFRVGAYVTNSGRFFRGPECRC